MKFGTDGSHPGKRRSPAFSGRDVGRAPVPAAGHPYLKKSNRNESAANAGGSSLLLRLCALPGLGTSASTHGTGFPSPSAPDEPPRADPPPLPPCWDRSTSGASRQKQVTDNRARLSLPIRNGEPGDVFRRTRLRTCPLDLPHRRLPVASPRENSGCMPEAFPPAFLRL